MITLLICLAGGLGAVARYAIDRLVYPTHLREIPVSIAIINITGSFIIGLGSGWLADDSAMLKILATGFCGGFTTFSSAMADLVALTKKGRIDLALLLAVGVVAAAVLAAAIGLAAGNAL